MITTMGGCYDKRFKNRYLQHFVYNHNGRWNSFIENELHASKEKLIKKKKGWKMASAEQLGANCVVMSFLNFFSFSLCCLYIFVVSSSRSTILSAFFFNTIGSSSGS